ncbi:MAG TPA: ABC transporter permease, partial [Gammaproteobacteria bacterium]|nr:ABC transporter permease [Gammaproteobacteria bacterium]
MKFLPLVWAGLMRKRVRTVLAMISVAIAFWLYGTLDGVTAAFDDALIAMTSEVRLRTQSRQNVRAGLPLAHRARIEAVPGVRDVGFVTFVGGLYQDSVDFIEVSAIDIERVDAGGSFDVDPAQVEAMRRLRTGAIIGPELAQRYGWKIGDRVTVRSPVWAKEDGSNDWTFDIVGVYGIPEGAFPADGNFWINYDY